MVATYNVQGDIGSKFDFMVELYNSLCDVLSYKFNHPGKFGWGYDYMPEISSEHPYYRFDLINYHLVDSTNNSNSENMTENQLDSTENNVYDFDYCIIDVCDGERVKIMFNNNNITPTETLDVDVLGHSLIPELTNRIDNIDA